jgi:3-oxoacyl-[acyl-carrier protein] reductase
VGPIVEEGSVQTSETGRHAVVTGGGTGIGRATAHRLAKEGFGVVVVGRRREVLEQVADEIGATVVVADLTRPADVERAAEEITAAVTTVDALVLNAGGGQHGPTASVQELAQHWTTSVEQNLLTAVLLERALRPHLRRPGGRIVAISSTSSFSGGGEVAYAGAKAAMNRWIVAVASEVGVDGITANVLAPGFVPDTELYARGLDPAWVERIAQGIAMRRVGTPDDIADGIAWLVSPGASWVNGTVLTIDGGRTVTL